MCGITGFIDLSRGTSHQGLQRTIIQMTNQLYHRGPDDQGIWADAEVGLAFGHRRLSIIDLSPEGHQPMISVSGRYVIVFNGEIYNFKVLRDKLAKETGCLKLRGQSDTEVMLAAIEAWGLDTAVKNFIGMFAFALLDRKMQQLYLVRDRLGEKPLYYGLLNNTFIFGSELKALRAHPVFDADINHDALALLLRHNYIPAPYTIYKGVNKLTPGTILTLSLADSAHTSVKTYWSAKQVANVGLANLFEGDESEAVNQLDLLLRDAIKQQMVADVPLGAFLSGGIDSSTVVALMQAQSSQPVKTFSIGFYEAGYNEAKHAKAVAKHLKTEHTELYITSQQAMDVIPKLPALYDEPFSDSSQIPTHLVALLARQHVTVSLSGDGGDELFGGYNRYFWGTSIWNKIGRISPGLRRQISKGIRSASPQTWNRLLAGVNSILPTKLKQQLPGDKLHKIADILCVESPEALYHSLISHWKSPSKIVTNSSEPLTALTNQEDWGNLNDFVQKMMYLDTVTYLPDDILVKVDRACMGVSLESRIPLLDHRVVEFAWRLPNSLKIRDGQGKWILRQVLYQYVPRELIERPKMGFGVPIDHWLRGPLREWAEELINEKRLRQEGFFNPSEIRQKWQEHCSGKRNWQYYLWDILMFQAWLEEHK